MPKHIYKASLETLLVGLVTDCVVPSIAIAHITNDSRQVKPGSAFFAYPGDVANGCNYIEQAVATGAAAIVYEASQAVPTKHDVPMIPVANLQQKLGEIASRFYGRPSEQLTMIGVTGTNGKTSITQFIGQALTQLGDVVGVIGTTGIGIWPNIKASTHTTPEPIMLQRSLAELRAAGATHVVMEVSSHGLVQGRVNAIDFLVTVFSNLSHDHLDYHQTMQDYAEAKALLFKMPNVKYAVINADDACGCDFIERFKADLEVVAFRLSNQDKQTVPEIVATQVKATDHGFTVQLTTPWGKGEFTTTLLGQFNVSNLLATIGVLGVLSVPFTKILSVIANTQHVTGRMHGFSGKGRAHVVVDYSHTPDALQKALVELRQHCHGRLWCVFGCGGNRDKSKRPLMGKVAEQLSDVVVVTNDNPRHEQPEAIVADILQGLYAPEVVQVILDRGQAIDYCIQHAAPEDVVLVAGKGHETQQVIGDRILPFSDVAHIKQCYEGDS